MNDQQIDEKFDKVDKNFDEMRENFREIKTSINDLMDIVGFISVNAVSKDEFNELKQEVAGIKKDVSGLKQDTTYFKSNMVTKDYLDEKLYDFKTEIIQETRAGEKQLERLAGILIEKKVISPTQHQFVMRRQP